MYQCRHFSIEELVPPHVFKERGERAWQLLDTRALLTLDALRNHFGRTVVNNWHTNGNRKWSGLRTKDCPQYSEYSQHTYGRAFDCIFMEAETEIVRAYVLANKNKFPEITAIETDVSWFHFDVRNCVPIQLFSPVRSK